MEHKTKANVPRMTSHSSPGQTSWGPRSGSNRLEVFFDFYSLVGLAIKKLLGFFPPHIELNPGVQDSDRRKKKITLKDGQKLSARIIQHLGFVSTKGSLL
ncbi:hypothetical protein CDAR_468311 [Caerostris darwini]|uniref:Uncharacterized protein n=1 Tax=Caerostris darwini TaxID=1538125 RepID=A0AAV4WUS8_9ARAC|nr:hypothetical protein CDAR_468311 [Caerostris darwini]